MKAPITKLTRESLKDSGLDGKSIGRAQKMFALGIVYWMFNRPMEQTENFLKKKFEERPEVVEANIKVLHVGYNFADTIEALSSSYTVLSADLEKGTYRNVMGNHHTALGFSSSSQNASKELFLVLIQ